MTIPILLGQPIHLWLGILVLLLIMFEIAVVKKILPISFRWHRMMGYVILLLAIVHGTLAAGLYQGVFAL